MQFKDDSPQFKGWVGAWVDLDYQNQRSKMGDRNWKESKVSIYIKSYA
jgi:hypothetical protein